MKKQQMIINLIIVTISLISIAMSIFGILSNITNITNNYSDNWQEKGTLDSNTVWSYKFKAGRLYRVYIDWDSVIRTTPNLVYFRYLVPAEKFYSYTIYNDKLEVTKILYLNVNDNEINITTTYHVLSGIIEKLEELDNE